MYRGLRKKINSVTGDDKDSALSVAKCFNCQQTRIRHRKPSRKLQPEKTIQISEDMWRTILAWGWHRMRCCITRKVDFLYAGMKWVKRPSWDQRWARRHLWGLGSLGKGFKLPDRRNIIRIKSESLSNSIKGSMYSWRLLPPQGLDEPFESKSFTLTS
jgi:hypothetical protein